MRSHDRFEREFFGSVVLRDRWRDVEVKGLIVRSRRRYLAARAPGSVAAIRAGLSEAARVYLDGNVALTARVPYAPLVELDAAIVEHAMGGDVTRMREFGRDIALHDLRGAYRGALRVVGDTMSLKVDSVLWETIRRPGRARSEPSEGGHVLVVEGIVLPRSMCEQGVSGYVEGMMEVVGTPSVVRHECVHDGYPACRWTVKRAGERPR